VTHRKPARASASPVYRYATAPPRLAQAEDHGRLRGPPGPPVVHRQMYTCRTLFLPYTVRTLWLPAVHCGYPPYTDQYSTTTDSYTSVHRPYDHRQTSIRTPLDYRRADVNPYTVGLPTSRLPPYTVVPWTTGADTDSWRCRTPTDCCHSVHQRGLLPVVR